MNCTASLQHGNFSHEDFGELAVDDILSKLLSIDWAKDLRLLAEGILLQGDVCVPGFYVSRPGDEYLACYPVSQGQFVLNICLTTGRTWLGRDKSREFALRPVQQQKLEYLVRKFATASSEELVELLSQEPLIEDGIPG